MRAATNLLNELRRAGIRVQVEGGDLRLRGPREALTPTLVARVRKRKPELLALKRGEVASPRAPDNRPVVAVSAPLAGRQAQDDRPACGHEGAVVFLTIQGLGTLCSDCWRRWVRGDITWPGGALVVSHERGQA